jgi:hypothetical protein
MLAEAMTCVSAGRIVGNRRVEQDLDPALTRRSGQRARFWPTLLAAFIVTQ